MSELKNGNEHRKAIITALEKKLPLLKALPKTSKKKDIIKSIIIDALEAFPEKIMALLLGLTR